MLKIRGVSDKGLVRERNEDAILAVAPCFNHCLKRSSKEEIKEISERFELNTKESPFVVAVFDGMGGAASGDVASRLGRDLFADTLTDIGSCRDKDSFTEQLGIATIRAHLGIVEQARHDETCRGMGTTLTAAGVYGKELFWVQVGDSRGYLLRQGGIYQITEDQSLVREMINSGRLTQEGARTYAHSNVILQALGINALVYPDVRLHELYHRDLLILCSDGLTDLISEEHLLSIYRRSENEESLCENLLAAANDKGGYDNISVIAVRYEDDGECEEGPYPQPVVQKIELKETKTRPPQNQQLILRIMAISIIILAITIIYITYIGS